MLASRRIRLLLVGVLFLCALLIPTGQAAFLEDLPTRVVMLVILTMSLIGFQFVSFQWSIFPILAVVFFGSPATKLLAGEVSPILWWITGLLFFLLSAQDILDFSAYRLKGLAQEHSALPDVPRLRLAGFHAPGWIIATALIIGYTVFVPVVVNGHTVQATLQVAALGFLAGAVLAVVASKWRVYAIHLGVAVLAVAFVEQKDFITFLGFGWLIGYVLACVLKDPTTIHRSLADVRKLTNTHVNHDGGAPSSRTLAVNRSQPDVNVAPLELGDFRFDTVPHSSRKLEARTSAPIRIAVTFGELNAYFDFEELAQLQDGPVLAEAVDARPPGDYFLVSAQLIDASSAAGENLRNRNYQEDDLLLLHGAELLAALSSNQRAELASWVQSIKAAL